MISFNAFMLVYDKRTTPSHRQRNLSSEIGLFFASHWFNRLSSTMVSVQEILAQSDLERNGAQDCGHKARLSWRIFHSLDGKYLSRLLVNQPTIWDQTFRTPIEAGLLVFNFRAWEYKRELAPRTMDQLLIRRASSQRKGGMEQLLGKKMGIHMGMATAPSQRQRIMDHPKQH